MTQNTNSRPNILLDLDQTLISSEPTEEINLKKKDVEEKAMKFKFHNMDGYYIVFERPGLQEFLTFLFDNFNVSIWTAASKDYALFVIDKVVIGNHPERKLDYLFFTEHGEVSNTLHKGSKDLVTLWQTFGLPGYNENNTFILDDLDEIYKIQKENCIPAKAFEFTKSTSPNDTFLKDLKPKLQNLLEKFKAGTSVKVSLKEINA